MIRVKCPGCGSQLKGADDAAGKRIKCPKCGGVVQIPTASAAADPFLGGDPTPAGAFDDEALPPRPMPSPSASPTREAVEPPLKSVKGTKPKKKKKGSPDDEDMSVLEWFVAIFCAGIGLIVSLVYMAQGKPKGKKLFGISLLVVVAWNVIGYLVRNSMKPSP